MQIVNDDEHQKPTMKSVRYETLPLAIIYRSVSLQFFSQHVIELLITKKINKCNEFIKVIRRK